MSNVKFFICRHCGNQVEMIHDAGVPVICCGEPMEELKANTVDASLEKHVPAVTVEGDTVKVQVGSAVHPMLEEHHIEWITWSWKTAAAVRHSLPAKLPKQSSIPPALSPWPYMHTAICTACGKPNYNSPLSLYLNQPSIHKLTTLYAL